MSDDRKEILMNFNFSMKQSLGRDKDPDYVLIKFWGLPGVLEQDGHPIFKDPWFKKIRIPRQNEAESVSVKATEAAAVALESSGKAALWIVVVLRMFFKYGMAEIIGMLCFMQLVVYLPLINVKFPSTALLLYSKIISVVTFDPLPTDNLYPGWFGIPETKAIGCLNEKEDGICLSHFPDFDYGSTNFVMNLGSMFIVLN